MDPFINQTAWTILIVISVTVIIGSLALVWKYAAPPEIPAQMQNRRQARAEQQDEAQVVRQNRDGMGRMRRRRQAHESEEDELQDQEPQDQEPQDQEPQPEDNDTERRNATPAALGKKKLKKLQEKEEKSKMREAMEEAKKARIEREDREIYERKKQQQLEQEKERLEEEELEKARQERIKREEEEYKSLKHLFSVEGDGSLLDDHTRFQQDEEAFIEYIKKAKVVYLEDLASKWRVKTSVIVDKINALESDGRLTGIIDERGKFIFITPQELAAVSKFIKIRGRVHISEIQRESNNLIDLNPADIPIDETNIIEEPQATQ